MTTVFFFGSLMYKDLLEVVLDRKVDDSDMNCANMFGYYKSRVDNERFPILIECDYSTVEGILATNMNNKDIDRLKFFETSDYTLVKCIVKTNNQFFNTKYFSHNSRLIPNGKMWDYETWKIKEKDICINLAMEIMQHYGKLPVSEIELMWHDIKNKHNKYVDYFIK